MKSDDQRLRNHVGVLITDDDLDVLEAIVFVDGRTRSEVLREVYDAFLLAARANAEVMEVFEARKRARLEPQSGQRRMRLATRDGVLTEEGEVK